MRRLSISVLLSALCLAACAQGGFPVYSPGIIYSYGNPVTVYPEGFVLTENRNLLLNGGREAVIPPFQESREVILSDTDGQSVKQEIRLISTNAERVSNAGNALVLCIGESTTETINPDPFSGSYDSGWNWVSMMKAISTGHGTAVTCLGTDTMKDASIKACYTAHGGWSSYTYLNWPCAAKMDPGAPEHFFKSETMWYALGLQGVTGEPFREQAWQYDLMARTPFGKYSPDKHPSLIEFAKSVSGRYGFPDYNGSIKRWADDLARNPVNEFYSLEAAKSGSYAFSLEKYLERYRTLDDSGNRLVSYSDNPAGEKVRGKDGKYYRIGSRIVSRRLLEKVSVCRPTHVVVNIGINDGDSSSSVEATSESLGNLLSSFPGVPVAHFVMRWPGACFPGLWAPDYLPRQYAINGNNKRVMAIMTDLAGKLQGGDNICLLDVWHCQSPVSQHQEKYSGGVLDCSINDVHTGYAGQMSAANQVLGWLYHCLGQGL